MTKEYMVDIITQHTGYLVVVRRIVNGGSIKSIQWFRDWDDAKEAREAIKGYLGNTI